MVATFHLLRPRRSQGGYCVHPGKQRRSGFSINFCLGSKWY